MSCTIFVVPAALAIGNAIGILPILTGAVAVGATALGIMSDNNIDFNTELGGFSKNDMKSKIENFKQERKLVCEDVHIHEMLDFIEKQFETPFVDKEILIKTLEEHGCTEITELNGNLTCKCDHLSFEFKKSSADAPYLAYITCLEKDNIEEKLKDINSEYTLNVQEESYLNIVNKLQENNMEIESEEILEDNTIVLTVNIE